MEYRRGWSLFCKLSTQLSHPFLIIHIETESIDCLICKHNHHCLMVFQSCYLMLRSLYPQGGVSKIALFTLPLLLYPTPSHPCLDSRALGNSIGSMKAEQSPEIYDLIWMDTPTTYPPKCTQQDFTSCQEVPFRIHLKVHSRENIKEIQKNPNQVCLLEENSWRGCFHMDPVSKRPPNYPTRMELSSQWELAFVCNTGHIDIIVQCVTPYTLDVTIYRTPVIKLQTLLYGRINTWFCNKRHHQPGHCVEYPYYHTISPGLILCRNKTLQKL